MMGNIAAVVLSEPSALPSTFSVVCINLHLRSGGGGFLWWHQTLMLPSSCWRSSGADAFGFDSGWQQSHAHCGKIWSPVAHSHNLSSSVQPSDRPSVGIFVLLAWVSRALNSEQSKGKCSLIITKLPSVAIRFRRLRFWKDSLVAS